MHGPEDMKEYVSIFHSAFPDFRVTLDDQIAEGDKVVNRWTARGTHRGEFQGIPPTGKEVEFTGIHISRINEEGKLQESFLRTKMPWALCDRSLLFLHQSKPRRLR